MIIIFEGIDGCGKTTQANLLKERLKRESIDCTYMSFPSNSRIGRISNEVLSNKVEGIDENQRFCFVIADMLCELYGQFGIVEKLNQGVCIICDRFYLSTEVYQNKVNRDMLQAGRNVIFKDLNEAVIFFIDVSLEQAKGRIETRGKNELYEIDAIQQRVYNCYYEILKEYRNVEKYIIDGNQSIKSIAEQIYGIVKYKLNYSNEKR